MASDGRHLTGLWLDQQKYFADTLPTNVQPKSDVPVFDQTKAWLDRYFKGEKPEISELPLAPIGGKFRQAVWKILCDIPYGQVMTYGEIAKKIAQQQGRKSMSAQAVGV